MANTLCLCSVSEISKDYQHCLKFKSEYTRDSFFISKRHLLLSVNFKGDAFRSDITIPLSFDDTNTRKTDYVYFNGDDSKKYYYFVDEVEYLTSDTCKLHLTLDVWTTYQFDFELLHSYVEKSHVNRWESTGIPSKEIVDEGFANYQYVLREKEDLNVTMDGGILYASSTPLGVTGGGGGGASPEGYVIDTFGNYWKYPTTGQITAGYPNYSDNTFHGGWDIANVSKPGIFAPADGKIVTLRDQGDTGYGKYIITEHIGSLTGQTYRMWFCHLDSYQAGLYEGMPLVEGQRLGTMGNSGYTQGVTGIHLHWEARYAPYTAGTWGVHNDNAGYSTGDTFNHCVGIGDTMGRNKQQLELGDEVGNGDVLKGLVEIDG